MEKNRLEKYVKIISNSGWYDNIIKKLNPEIEDWIFVIEDNYNGDYCVAGKKDNKIYYLQGSFGSCSVCDWLERIQSFIEEKKYEKRDFTDEEIVEIEDFVVTMKKLVPIGKGNITTKEDVKRFIELEKNNTCFVTKLLTQLEQEIISKWFRYKENKSQKVWVSKMREKEKSVEKSDYTIAIVDDGEKCIELIEYHKDNNKDGRKYYLYKFYDDDVMWESWYDILNMAFLNFIDTLRMKEFSINKELLNDLYNIARMSDVKNNDIIKALGRIVTQLGLIGHKHDFQIMKSTPLSTVDDKVGIKIKCRNRACDLYKDGLAVSISSKTIIEEMIIHRNNYIFTRGVNNITLYDTPHGAFVLIEDFEGYKIVSDILVWNTNIGQYTLLVKMENKKEDKNITVELTPQFFYELYKKNNK